MELWVSPCIVGGSDQMAFKNPFQFKRCCDSMFWGCPRRVGSLLCQKQFPALKEKKKKKKRSRKALSEVSPSLPRHKGRGCSASPRNGGTTSGSALPEAQPPRSAAPGAARPPDGRPGRG